MADVAALTFDSPDAAPEALREWLVEDKEAGKFVAKVAPASKVEEFRGTNIKLLKERDDVAAKLKGYDGLDPAQARQWKQDLDRLNNEIKAGKAGTTDEAVQKLVDERLQSERATLKNQAEAADKARAAAEKQATEAQTQLNRLAVSSATASAANALGGFVPQALPEAIALIEREGTVKDGTVFFLDSAGGIIPGPDGKAPKTAQDRLAETKGSEKPHWWMANVNGGGAAGGAGDKGGGAKTMPRKEFDAKSPAEQKRLSKEGIRLTD